MSSESSSSPQPIESPVVQRGVGVTATGSPPKRLSYQPKQTAEPKNGPKRKFTARPRLYSAREWDDKYLLMKRLYVTEHRTLRELMSILEQEHGFKATEQMYKKRFAVWGLWKNKKRLSRIGTGSTSPGEHLSARPAVESGTTPPSSESPVREEKEPTWQLLHRKTVFEYQPEEEAVFSVSQWANGRFDGSCWQWSTHRLKATSIYSSTRLYQDFALATALWQRGEGCLAGKAVRKAFWRLDDVLRQGEPSFMRSFTDIIHLMKQYEQTKLMRIFVSYLASLASSELPSQHPLLRFIQRVSGSKEDENLERILVDSWRCFVCVVHNRMNSNYYYLYEKWAWDSSSVSMDTDPEADYRALTEAMEALALNTQSVEKIRGIRNHLDMVKCTKLIANDDFHETAAKEVIENIQCGRPVHLITTGVKSGAAHYVKSYESKVITKKAVDRGDWGVAEESMRSNIRDLEENYGETSHRVIRELWSLEKVLRKAGENAKAGETGEEAIQRVRLYLSDVMDDA